jgi:cyanamide hydratase
MSVSSVVRELDVSVVERDITAYLARHPSLSGVNPARISLAALPTPSTPLAEQALAYSHSQLDTVMFNHSCRVYYIGMAMAQHLHQPPSSSYLVDNEAYYLTSLFHDLGVGPAQQPNTRLSFEFQGALLAHRFILEHSQDSSARIPESKAAAALSLTPPAAGASSASSFSLAGPQASSSASTVAKLSAAPLADEVAEAIIRHTNFVKGRMTTTGQLIQLSTTLDVIGANQSLLHHDTYREIEAKWPRKGFNQHFAQLMEEEMKLKPWSHTTTVEEENGFCAKIRGNPYTAIIDKHHH